MNFELIGVLIRLRYKLLWAKTRTRNGKIALFFAGYLLLAMVLALLSVGGIGAGIQAMRSGRGTLVAGIVLGSIYAQGVLASVLLGFGMTTIFSDTELRRYPIHGQERRLVRHLIGIIDPYWMLFLALELGLAVGLYLFGAGSFWMGLLAVLILFVSNYMAARVLGMLVDRLLSKKGGAIALMLSVMLLGLLPSILQPLMHKDSPLVAIAVRVWHSLPPSGAAVAMTHTDLSAFSGLGLILLWTAALMAVLVLLEHKPVTTQVARSTEVRWEGRIDRVAAIFGPNNGPLVAHWLRFYSRNNRFRTIYPLALPLVAFLVVFYGKQAHTGSKLVNGVAGFAILGFVGTGQFAVNQFGYVGGGFRRFLLLPTNPAAAFRAGSYLFVSLSAALIPVGALIWALFPPAPTDARAMAMLLGAGVFSLFLFHGLALWTSLLGARRGNYNHTLGNDLSLAGNVVVIGGMLTMLFLPRILEAVWPPSMSPDNWWALPLLAVLAFAFYLTSLKRTTEMFRSQREQLMVLMEGRG